MPPPPLVSVVMPVRDGERYLAAAIESVLAQTYDELEIVVVDDGSRDASAEIAAGYEGVRIVSLEPSGISAARNAGIAASHGAYITFHDSDDLMKQEKVGRQVSFLEGNPDFDIVLTKQEVLLEPGAKLPFWAREKQLLLPSGHEHRQTQGPHGMTMLGRRAAFERVGEFAEEMPRAEDVDWIFRAHEAGIGITSIDEELLIRRVHPRNMTQEEEQSRKWLLEAFRRRMVRRRAAAEPGDTKAGAEARERD